MYCITINTDASFHPVAKVGGYAFVIVCDSFRIKKSGTFKNQPYCAREAEEMCIGNAIAILLKRKELPMCKVLIINGDCKFAFNTIIQATNKPTTATRVKKLLDELILRLGNPDFQFRYVKAHTDSSDARSRVNQWCDEEAKKWMRKSLKLANNGKIR